MTYTKELYYDDPDKAPEGAKTMLEVVNILRDEVASYLGLRYRGANRELSLALAQLDQARGWLILHGLREGTHALIDKRKIGLGPTDTTLTTDREETGLAEATL